MTLLAALQEAHAEIANGGPALTVIECVAADFGFNEDLLARKFAESYGDPETLKDRLDAAAAAEAAFQVRATADRIEARARADRENQILAEFFWNRRA